MSIRRHHGLQAVLAMAIGALLAPSVMALHPHRPYVEADIESLSSSLYAGPLRWIMRVQYDVEVEGAYLDDDLDLILHVSEYGRPVLDAAGRPTQIIVPLRRPSGFDDDEIRFTSGTIIRLPYRSINSPNAVTVHGVLVSRATGFRLAARDSGVSFTGGAPYSYGQSPRYGPGPYDTGPPWRD